MADMRNDEFLEDDVLIEMTDEEGNVFYYVEEMIIPVDGVNFALLVEWHGDHDHCDCDHDHGDDCGCGCGGDCGCDDDVIIAKIVTGADGQDEYIEPTDEEFEKVQAAYEKLLDEAE